MSLSQVGAASNALSPFASNWRGLDAYRQNGSAGPGASSANTPNGLAGSDRVSLSDASRVLAALGGSGANASGNADSPSANGTGSSDFSQEASYLGGIADASLVALGIITPDQQSGTQVSFDSLSYQVSSSVSAGISQQNGQTIAQYGSDQQAEFIGQGHITTADGRTFNFQIEVDLEQSQQAEAVSNAGNGGSGADAPGNVPSSVSSAAPSSTPAPGNASAASSPLDPINWDEILKESKSLIDLLESIGKLDQSGNANKPAVLANAAAGNAASNQGTGSAAPAQGAASSTAQEQQNQSAAAATAAAA